MLPGHLRAPGAQRLEQALLGAAGCGRWRRCAIRPRRLARLDAARPVFVPPQLDAPLAPQHRAAGLGQAQHVVGVVIDLDDVLRRAVRLLAQLTRQVAVVQYPTLSASTVRHLEVVALTPARLLMVVITDSGRVDQRIVELGDTIDEHQVGQLRDVLSKALEGKRLSAASVAVAELANRLHGGTGQAGTFSDAVGRSATVLLESLVEHSEERLVMGGTANLTRNTADFGGSLRSVLEALEEQVVVLRLLAAQQDAGKVTVRIGHETEAEQMAGTSVIATTYGSAGTVYGGMGVVGPTRMDYPGTMANVAAVAMYIGEVLGNRAG